MNKNRILSTALVIVMMLTVFLPIIPVRSEAAYSSQVSANRLSDDEVKKIVETYQKATFADAETMFKSDLDAGYLDKSTNGAFSIYVNRYTGVMYYRNEATGEMLTSNSYNFKKVSEDLTSQVALWYSTVSDTENEIKMNSSKWAAIRNQITVTRIDGGLRVSYAMGNTAIRELVPLAIEVNAFEERILRPMADLLETKAAELLGEGVIPNYFDSEFYDKEEVMSNMLLHFDSLDLYNKMVKQELAKAKAKPEYKTDADYRKLYKEVEDINKNIFTFFSGYSQINPSHSSTVISDEIMAKAPILGEGYSIYLSTTEDIGQLVGKAKILKALCPNYTFEMMYEDEEFCGYTAQKPTEPVFRFSLEYTINEDGTLSVRLPSNSIVFDETQYILKRMAVLPYFGAADFQRDGYIFVPDGSGAVIEYEEFRNSNVAMELNTYGQDYCYSEILGSPYNQHVTMPVYGSVSQVQKGGELLDTGFFAIIEEGSASSSIKVDYTSTQYSQGSVYALFNPYPTDKFDLSGSLSVGGADYYSMVAESKYAGSYVTRYTMLSANPLNKIGGESGKAYYPSYVGMVECYRDYLEANGVISEIENASKELPLYIEALGSIEVVEKVLTFPVNVSRAITTFDNIADIYNELSTAQNDAKARLLAKADEYQALADAEEANSSLKKQYLSKAESYKVLAEKIVDIKNINFKLTGFANGGMYFTYPTKVKWERSLGGKRDFKNLLETAKEINSKTGYNFGIYPEFDFQYVNNTALFDGVGKRDTLSRMVDNRYASKQAYSNITGEFDTIYAMVVSPEALDRLYDKFIKKYGKYNATGLSVSTLGSDLNSNFDEDSPVARDDAMNYVSDLLDRMANESNYSVMISSGNIYAAQYADHILDICTDSSYYRYSSYAIPFFGMVLHGYVNYTGAAFNYSGSPDYDLLRSIESGAALYYILGYQNTDLMKDDEELNKYYSVSYQNWFDNIVENYAKLNAEIGDIPDYKIVDHKVLIGERIIDDDEVVANLDALKEEFIDQLDIAISDAINAKYDEMFGVADGVGIELNVDVDSLLALAHERFELSDDESLGAEFTAELNALVEYYKEEHNVVDQSDYAVVIDASSIDYESRFKYVTGSYATDKDYEKTDYTIDNDLIVMVTYKNDEGKIREFILNYNIYSVRVTFENGESYDIEKYGFERIDR